ncbi:MAG: FHA domain-containing protein [Clostridia bacterium]|nr:FHA domain-containing protein [Clostridia bacterium]
MICNAKPYEGKDAYLFVSYARKDAGIVYPLLERLASEGVRLWYDAGIHSGENWPEVIAEHLDRSAACLVFMTVNAASSHNCYSELIFAVESKKPLIPIRYNDAPLSLGMRMMIGAVQWQEIRGIPTDGDVSKILSLDLVRPTHGIADRSIVTQSYVTDEQESAPKVTWKPEPIMSHPEQEEPAPVVPQSQPVPETPEPAIPQFQPEPKDQPVVPPEPEAPKAEPLTEPQKPAQEPVIPAQEVPAASELVPHEKTHKDEPKPIAPKPAPAEPASTSRHRRSGNREIEINKTQATQQDWEEAPGEKTVAEPAGEDPFEKTVAENAEDIFDQTIRAAKDILPTIVALMGDGFRSRGKMGVTVIGRSKAKADVVVPDPDRKVSGAHCKIVSLDGIHSVEDMESTNGTWMDGEELPAGERRPVDRICELLLHRVRVLVAFDADANALWNTETLLSLQCEETGEIQYLWKDQLKLGRSAPWRENVLSDHHVSFVHASLRIIGKNCLLVDEHSTNGTFINGEKLDAGAERNLETGDVIRIGGNHFIVTLYHFEGGEA